MAEATGAKLPANLQPLTAEVLEKTMILISRLLRKITGKSSASHGRGSGAKLPANTRPLASGAMQNYRQVCSLSHPSGERALQARACACACHFRFQPSSLQSYHLAFYRQKNNDFLAFYLTIFIILIWYHYGSCRLLAQELLKTR